MLMPKIYEGVLPVDTISPYLHAHIASGEMSPPTTRSWPGGHRGIADVSWTLSVAQTGTKSRNGTPFRVPETIAAGISPYDLVWRDLPPVPLVPAGSPTYLVASGMQRLPWGRAWLALMKPPESVLCPAIPIQRDLTMAVTPTVPPAPGTMSLT